MNAFSPCSPCSLGRTYTSELIKSNNTTPTKYMCTASLPEQCARAGKILHLLPNDTDAAVIRSVQLQHHAVEGGAIDLACHRQDGGRLARPRGPVEQQVRQLVCFHQPLDCAPPEENVGIVQAS